MLLGGIGTSCVALDAAKFGETMAPLASYQWLYKIFVVLTTGSGLAGIWAAFGLIRRMHWGSRWALWSLMVGSFVGGIHMFVSETLRGASAPANMVFYFTVFTLAVFVLLRYTRIGKGILWDKSDNPDGPSIAGGAALLVSGVLTISTPVWAMPTHILVGQNWVNQLIIPLLLAGGGMIFCGLLLLKKGVQEYLQGRRQRVTSIHALHQIIE